MLLGIAIRTGSPLSLNLAEPVWKQLAGMSLTIADLSEVTPWGGRRGLWGLVNRHSLFCGSGQAVNSGLTRAQV